MPVHSFPPSLSEDPLRGRTFFTRRCSRRLGLMFADATTRCSCLLFHSSSRLLPSLLKQVTAISANQQIRPQVLNPNLCMLFRFSFFLFFLFHLQANKFRFSYLVGRNSLARPDNHIACIKYERRLLIPRLSLEQHLSHSCTLKPKPVRQTDIKHPAITAFFSPRAHHPITGRLKRLVGTRAISLLRRRAP